MRYVLVGGGSIFKFRSANSADVNITSGFFWGSKQRYLQSALLFTGYISRCLCCTMPLQLMQASPSSSCPDRDRPKRPMVFMFPLNQAKASYSSKSGRASISIFIAELSADNSDIFHNQRLDCAILIIHIGCLPMHIPEGMTALTFA